MATTDERTLQPTLTGVYYADESVFQREQVRIFSREWICTARIAELAEAGSFETYQIAGESVVVVRGHDQVIRAFYNVCRHRGSRLCLEERGRLGRNFQCPYHVWSYALDGRLTGAPNLGEIPDIERAERSLLPVPTREWLGYVWICLADDPPDFAGQVEQQVTDRFGDPALIERYALDQLALGHRVEYDVHANWKLIVENFMECYHCSNLHPELVAVLPEFRRGYATQDKVGYGAAFGEGIQGFTFDGRPGLDPLPGVDGELARSYYGLTVVPQVVVNLAPDHVIFHRFFPVSAGRTRVRCDWLFAPEAIAGGRDLQPSIELFRRVNEQDFAAVEACQPSMSSRAYRQGGVYVPAEHHIAGFNGWVAERLAGS